jgi:septation ring formation regulator EzrA
MLGQQLEAIQRDLVIVREEHGANPKVLQHVKKMETQLRQAKTIQKSLYEECCKTSPDGKVCVEMCSKIHASLEELRKEHDQVLKELGHEEAAYTPTGDAHQHQNSPPARADK